MTSAFALALATVAVAAAAAERAVDGGRELPEALLDIAAFARPVSVALLPAAGMHVLLAFVGRSSATDRLVAVGYLAGATSALVVWQGGPAQALWPVALEAVAFAAVVLVAAARRYQTAPPLERRRLRWLVWAVVAGAEVALWAVTSRLLWDWPTSTASILAAASVPFPLALAAARGRRASTGVDTLLERTIAVAGTTGLMLAVGLVLLAGLDRIPTGRDRSLIGLSMLAAGGAGVAYQPVRAGLSRVANRLIYGARQPPDHVLRTFGSRLSRATPMDELLLQVAESLRTTLSLETAEIWTGSGGRIDRVASVPDAPPAHLLLGQEEEAVVRRAGVSGPAWARVWVPELVASRGDVSLRVASITHASKLLGLILVVRPAGAEPFTREEEQVLAELARQLGLALHNVHLDSALQASVDELERRAQELQASRARLVAASDDARRQIERNLHDGAQQHLIGLIANLRLALQVGKSDQRAATEMLEELGRGLQAAVQELRALAHGIYPPVLVQRGLGPALVAAAGATAVEVVADGGRRYPADVEAAVYFCCLEALQNAGKHAGPGASVTVRLWEEAGALRFEVVDDGVGFDPGERRRDGAGFANMADRVGAIGGNLVVESAPRRGTRISARIPLP